MLARRSLLCLAIAVVALGATACTGTSSDRRVGTGATTTPAPSTTAGSKTSGALTIAIAPWKLAAPIANEVLATDGTQLTILGGLDATKLSTNAVVRVNPTTGASQPAGTLAEAVHDAAGVRIGTNTLVIGGGGPSENGSADAQIVSPDGHTAIVGKMPQPRSDHVAAAVGGKIYVLGGYDGANIVGDVVTTTDGTSFAKLSTLPVPVRYPAIAVLDSAIYLFGGVASTNGTDTAAIQRLDTTTGAITVVGQLPTTVSHASAVVLDNTSISSAATSTTRNSATRSCASTPPRNHDRRASPSRAELRRRRDRHQSRRLPHRRQEHRPRPTHHCPHRCPRVSARHERTAASRLTWLPEVDAEVHGWGGVVDPGDEFVELPAHPFSVVDRPSLNGEHPSAWSRSVMLWSAR